MSRRTAAMVVLVVALMAAVARGGGLSPSEAAEHLAQAAAAYDAGVAKLATDRAGAAAQFKEAAALYRLLVESGTGASGPMYLNLGNAYLLAGDRGRAVLAYRRGERLMPFDSDLTAALSAAREKIGADAPPPPAAPAWQGAVDAARALPERTRWLLFAGAFGAAWLLALARLLGVLGDGWSARFARWAMMSFAILATIWLASVIGPEIGERAHRRGVVVAANAATRTGPSDAVHGPGSPALLPGGSEFVLEERIGDETEGWSRVRLGTGAAVWVRSREVEMVAGSP